MSTSAAFLVAALVFATAAGFLMGQSLFEKAARLHKSDGRARGTSFGQMLEDSTFVFVLSMAFGGIVSVIFSLWLMLPALLVAALLARRLPTMAKEKKKKMNGLACEEDLDLLCDIVAMGMGAGLSFDAALGLYCSRFNNLLSKRMAEARAQWVHGVAKRTEVLKALADELESSPLRQFAGTVSQSVDHGAPLAGMLRRLAAELRQARKTRIERQVERAPVKMLVTTGIFILPAMLILVMGPMLLQFMGA